MYTLYVLLPEIHREYNVIKRKSGVLRNLFGELEEVYKHMGLVNFTICCSKSRDLSHAIWLSFFNASYSNENIYSYV